MSTRFKNIIMSFLMFAAISCDTENNLEPRFEEYFIKYFGGQGNQIGIDVEKLADGGFIILGNSISTVGNSQLFVVRTDNLGNEIWSNTYGGSENDFASDLAIDVSGNIVIGATIMEAAGSFTDAMIYKIDPFGNKIDSAVYGTVGTNEEVNSIMITGTGDIIIAGSTNNVDILKTGYNAVTDLHDIYSVRVNSGLQVLPATEWKQVYGFSGEDFGQQIVEKPDGSFLFFGTTDKPSSNAQQSGLNMFLFPVNNQGDATSSIELQLYGTLDDEHAGQISSTSDGGFVMIGTTEKQNKENDIFIARIRSNNDFLSAALTNSGTNVTGASIIESKSGGFLALGVNDVGGAGNIYLAKTSSSGAIDWSSTFGNVDNDLGSKVIQLSDGSILIVGTIELESQTKMCLIKTNSSGKLIP
jgi:hypothetical protein